MDPRTHEVRFSGRIVQRAFWLYVYEATVAEDKVLLYVGRTGDSSSSNAQSAYRRLGQHLDGAATSTTNQLRRYLAGLGIEPTDCAFRFVAHGPLFEEAQDQAGHDLARDVIAACEKQLAADLRSAKYEVLNPVHSLKSLDETLYTDIREAFAAYFPALSRLR